MDHLSSSLRHKLWKWFRWTVLFLFGWFIVFFMLFGPGRILIPRLLVSYSHVTDHTNTVYYSGNNILKALDVLWMASTVRDSISTAEGDTTGDAFSKGIVIVMSESTDQYEHLTWNCPKGAMVMRRIVLNPDECETNRALFSTLKREMHQVYISRHYGRFSSLVGLTGGDDTGKR